MAALDFPDAPTNGQVYDKWTWNGTVWVLTTPGGGSGSGSGFTFSQEATPTATAAGQTWYNTATGISSVWVVDANSSQWVQYAPGGGGGGAVRSSGAALTTAISALPLGSYPVFTPAFNVPLTVQAGDSISMSASLWVASSGGVTNAFSFGFGLWDQGVTAFGSMRQDFTPPVSNVTQIYIEVSPTSYLWSYSLQALVSVSGPMALWLYVIKSTSTPRDIGHASVRSSLSAIVTKGS